MGTIDIQLKSYDDLQFEIMRLITDKYLLEQENKQLKDRINKAIEEIECEIERYDGSNEDFISASWVEMKTDDYIAKLKNILEILGDKENENN